LVSIFLSRFPSRLIWLAASFYAEAGTVKSVSPCSRNLARPLLSDERLREEQEEKAIDSMRINSEFISNEIDASELPLEKHSEQKI
jgi:hypothetical protein